MTRILRTVSVSIVALGWLWWLQARGSLFLPVLMTGTLVAIRLAASWVAHRPELINLPGKKSVRALPELHRGPVVEAIRELFAILEVEAVVILGLVSLARRVAATGADDEAVILGILAVSVLATPVILVQILIRMPRATETAWREAERAGHRHPGKGGERDPGG